MNGTNQINQNPISLYDLCGEDHYIFANLEKDGEVSVIVENEEQKEVYHEKSHFFAWDSLVSFAKMVLQQDEKIQKGLEHHE